MTLKSTWNNAGEKRETCEPGEKFNGTARLPPIAQPLNGAFPKGSGARFAKSGRGLATANIDG